MARTATSKISESDWDWRTEARCKSQDNALFYEIYEKGDDLLRKRILRTCDGCPVIEECADFAVRSKAWGVHAGAYYASGKRKKFEHRNEE